MLALGVVRERPCIVGRRDRGFFAVGAYCHSAWQFALPEQFFLRRMSSKVCAILGGWRGARHLYCRIAPRNRKKIASAGLYPFFSGFMCCFCFPEAHAKVSSNIHVGKIGTHGDTLQQIHGSKRGAAPPIPTTAVPCNTDRVASLANKRTS